MTDVLEAGVHGIGNRTAARMADDVDLVRVDRLDIVDHRIKLATLAEVSDGALGRARRGPQRLLAREADELDARLLQPGAMQPFVDIGRTGKEAAEEKDRRAHCRSSLREPETSAVPLTI